MVIWFPATLDTGPQFVLKPTVIGLVWPRSAKLV
jgi:hypothetical protein